MLFALLTLACAPAADAVAPPTVTWLAPADGDAVTAGEVAASVIVDAFSLEDPARHNAGTPIGYLRVCVDGAEALTTGATAFTLSLTPGEHVLSASLYYADGDAVKTTPEALCGDADTGCAAAEARIAITATD